MICDMREPRAFKLSRSKATFFFSACLILSSLMMLACESRPPETKTAVPLSWEESSTIQLSSQAGASTVPWRKMEVLTRGVLSIGLQANKSSGLVKLSVRNEAGRRQVFQKEVELAPASPLTMAFNVEAGTYYLVLESTQNQPVNASISVRFQPEDPDALSGSDKGREGAHVLVHGQVKEGAVSYRNGNRTNWYKYDVLSSEFAHIEFRPNQMAKGVKAECITPTGLSFELKGQDKVVLREPGHLWIRAYADQPDSVGEFTLKITRTPSSGVVQKGMILKFNANAATINLGSDDGIQVGQMGFIQRPDGKVVDFVIEKVLQRSSTAQFKSNLQDEDLNMNVQFEKRSL
jgi:hypothetical protein